MALIDALFLDPYPFHQWIARRSDGIAGTGTLNDPLNADTPEKFDIITSDPIHPWVKGTSALYSKEYFELVRSHLNPGGIAAQWLPLYESDEETVARRFRQQMVNSNSGGDETFFEPSARGRDLPRLQTFALPAGATSLGKDGFSGALNVQNGASATFSGSLSLAQSTAGSSGVRRTAVTGS